jgi:hypothetical protein
VRKYLTNQQLKAFGDEAFELAMRIGWASQLLIWVVLGSAFGW